MNSTQHAVPFTAANRAAALLDRLWHASPPLTAVGLLMLVAAGASLVAMLVDPRIITGAPAWLKPFKFAISTAVYSLTLAWIFRWLSDWPRVRRVVGWTTAIVFVLEVVMIDAQAWRGTTSHFNVSTTLNMVLFFVMGGAILLQTLVSVAIAVALWRQRFTDRALGWALRLGMTLTIVGALTGPLMTRPTAAQLADARSGKRMTTAGAHTRRRPGWRSRRAGDRLESRARRSARSALHRPARDSDAGAHRGRAAALAPAREPFASGRCWLPQQAMRRCFSCCSGRRCGDKASWRPMRRHSHRSQSGRWSPWSSLVGSALAPEAHWKGRQYDYRSSSCDPSVMNRKHGGRRFSPRVRWPRESPSERRYWLHFRLLFAMVLRASASRKCKNQGRIGPCK